MAAMECSYADFYERSRLSKARDIIKKFGLWTWGAIGLGSIIATYLGSVATEILPSEQLVGASLSFPYLLGFGHETAVYLASARQA